MTASVIGALRANLGLDSAQFEKGAKKAKTALDGMRTQFLAVAGAAAALGGALLLAARKGGNEIDAMAKAARRLDASIGAFQALSLAADEAGVPLSSLTNDIQSMNRELSNIGVSGNADRALERLGLTLADISGKDTDERLALIADQVRDLGLTSGEVTAVLRDLGIRNREMALLILGGGDAIRQARQDIADYGLEVSKVDASRIEAANDAISRLGIVSQYVGQRLALEIVPALGAMARAITDSMREGGALRAVLDAMINSLGVASASLGVLVTVLGVRYVGALVIARGAVIAKTVATMGLVGALGVLKTAVARVGFGALIIGAGYLVDWFARLVAKAGGFGKALSLLMDVGKEVFGRIGAYGDVMAAGLSIVFNNINDMWTQTLINMSVAFARFVDSVAETKLGGMLGFEGGNEGAAALRGAQATEAGTDAFMEAQARLREARARATAPLESAAAIRELMNAVDEVGETATEAAGNVSELEEAAGGAGGAASDLADKLTPLQEAMKQTADQISGELNNAFRSVLDGTKSAGDALLDFVNNVLNQIASNIFQNNIGNPLSTALGGLVNTFFGGGALAAQAIPASVIPAQKSGSVFNLNVRNEAGAGIEAVQVGPNDFEMRVKSIIASDIASGGQVGSAFNKTYQMRPGLARR